MTRDQLHGQGSWARAARTTGRSTGAMEVREDLSAAGAVDDCASASHCCGSAVDTYAGTFRCHLNLLPGNHEDCVIARIWRRRELPIDDDQYQAQAQAQVPLLTPLTPG